MADGDYEFSLGLATILAGVVLLLALYEIMVPRSRRQPFCVLGIAGLIAVAVMIESQHRLIG
jgi:hypothetical protein